MEGPAGGIELVLEEARRLGDDGDWAGMAERLREALEEFGASADVLCWLGVAEREMGLEGVAYERFKQALSLDPTDPHILATAGSALAHFDDPEAESALRVAALTAPDLPLARWMYGAYLSREGFPAEARRELDEARALDPEDPVIAYESGVAYALAGDVPRALEEMSHAAEMGQDAGWARVVLGLLLVDDDRTDEAVTDLDLGARLREDDVEAQLAAALAHGAVGDEDAAWEFLERARLHAQGTDTLAADAVEERLSEAEAGPVLEFLRQAFAPGMLRERLQTRP